MNWSYVLALNCCLRTGRRISSEHETKRGGEAKKGIFSNPCSEPKKLWQTQRKVP